jgi:hypothetical protein
MNPDGMNPDERPNATTIAAKTIARKRLKSLTTASRMKKRPVP